MGSQIGTIHVRDARMDDPDESAAIARVYFDGFITTVIHQLMYPGGASASAKEQYIRRLRSDLAPDPSSSSSPVRLYLKVAELLPANGDGEEAKPEIIAIARWRLVKETLSPEVWDVRDKDQMTQEKLGEGANLEIWRKFVGGVHEIRREMMRGDRCLHLGTLVCHPDHRGLGAASALLKWGVQLADQERIPAFLEASPHGYPLYKKFDFEDIYVQDLPLEGTGVGNEEDWGAGLCVALVGQKPKGCYRTPIMRRSPK